MASKNVNIEKVIGLMQKNLECSICLELLNNPVSTKCDHQFCRFCITQFLGSKRNVPCPLCKKPITKRALNDRPELGEIVENVQKLITAYQEDTGSIFSPPKGPDVMNFLSCTPDPLPTKPVRGTKRKIIQTEQNHDTVDRNSTTRRSKRKKDVDSAKNSENNRVNNESEMRPDDVNILLLGDNTNDELLNYLETGSCGAVVSEKDLHVSSNHLDSTSAVGISEKKTGNTRRRTRSAEKSVTDGDIKSKTETVLLPDENSRHLSCDIAGDQINLGEICDKTGDAKTKKGQCNTEKNGNANVKELRVLCLKMSDDFSDGKAVSSETHHHEENENHNKCMTRNIKNTRNNIDKNDLENRRKSKNLQKSKDETSDQGDVLFNDIHMDENEVINSQNSDVLFNDIEINENESNVYCGKLRERKTGKSMKELSDSLGEDESSLQMTGQSVSDKTSENGEFFNKTNPKVQKTYSRKLNGQPKNDVHREKMTDVNRVNAWVKNLPENKDVGENGSCEQFTPDVEKQLSADIGTEVNGSGAVIVENEPEDSVNMLPENVDMQLNTKGKGTIISGHSIAIDNKAGGELVHDKIHSQLKTNGRKLCDISSSDDVNKGGDSIKINCIPCADTDNINGGNVLPVVPQRKRIFKCTRETGAHDHMTIKQCKGTLSFKMVNSENANKPTKTWTLKCQGNDINEKDKGKVQNFTWDEEESEETSKKDKNKQHIIQPDAGQESDPYEFKSSQKTPVRGKNKNKKLKNKKSHKKGQLQIKFVENSKKGGQSNPVEIVSDDEDDNHDDKDMEIDSKVNPNCTTGKSSVTDVENKDVKKDRDVYSEKILESKVIQKAKKGKKQKGRNVALTQKDFDDLEKLKDKISDAEDYDLLTSTQEASEKICKEQERGSTNLTDVIPDSECMQNSEKMKTKKKVSFCSDVNIIKHPSETNKVEVKILKKNNTLGPVTVIQETQSMDEYSNDNVKTQTIVADGGKEKPDSVLKRNNKIGMKILKKNNSPNVVNVIEETQNISQSDRQVLGSGFKLTDKHSKDLRFKHPADVEVTESKKILKSQGMTRTRMEELGTSYPKNNVFSKVDVCTDSRVNNPVDDDIDSSGTDDLDVEPSQEEFETINLDIQPKEIKERLSQDLNSQSLVKTSENTSQYKSPLRQLPSECEKAVLSVQETPQIQLEASQCKTLLTPQIQIEKSTCENLKSTQKTVHNIENSEIQTFSRKKFTRKKKKVETDMGSSGPPTVCVVEETPVVSVVKETPAVSMVTLSASLIQETQLPSAQMSESPLPKSDVCKITPVSSISSVETMIGESETLPSFVLNQMEIENSNIQETQISGNCETGTDDTQQSVSILTLPNKTHQEELLADTQSQKDLQSNQLVDEMKENLQIDQGIGHVEKELKEQELEDNKKLNTEKLDLALNTKRNKLKKKKSKSPSIPSIETPQSGSCKKREELNSSDYVPATEGASREVTPIIPIVLLENFEKNSEIVPESLSCNFTTPASAGENDVTHKQLIENDCEKSWPVFSLNENHVHEKPDDLKNQTYNHLNSDKKDSDVVLVKCEETKDTETQESVAEDLSSTLVSLQTIKKLEKSLSKDMKCSPDDIFMLDSESPTQVKHFDDDDDAGIPQNQEGVCFMNFENSESQVSLKPSQEKKDFNCAKGATDVESKADTGIDICENKKSEIEQTVFDGILEKGQSENQLDGNSLVASEIRKDDVTVIKDSMDIIQTSDSMVKSASESQKKVCSSSKINESKQTMKEKDSESDSENDAELKRVKVKTKRGLARRIKLSAAQKGNDSMNSESVECLVTKKTKTSNRENKMDVIDLDLDLENKKHGEEVTVSNSIVEKVSPKFLNSPQKRFTPSKKKEFETSENIENIQRSYTPKRTSLTFKKIPRKSGRHGNPSQDSDAKKESVNVVSESRMSRVKETVDPSYHDNENNEVISESQLSRVKESDDLSYHDDMTDVINIKPIDKINEIQSEKSSRKQKLTKGHESLEITNNIRSGKRSSKRNDIIEDDEMNDSDTSVKHLQKKKKVKLVESSSNEDEDFDRSSPLPDVFRSSSKNEAISKTRQTLVSSSEDEEFVLRDDEKEPVTPVEEEETSLNVKHQGDTIVKQSEDLDSDVVMVSQTSAQLFSDDEEDMENDVINGGSKSPTKSDMENEDSEIEVVVRNPSGKHRNVITDDYSSDDESLQDSSQQMNMTSSSAFSSQSEAMTTQKKEDLEKDLERMRKQILDLEAQLSATKHSTSKQDREKRSQNSDDSSIEGNSIRKRSKRKRVAVRRLSSDSSDDNDDSGKGGIRVVSESGEDGESKADTEIHQYPSSGDESDELFLTPLPPSPPPLPSQEQLIVQTDLPAPVKESDEFLKKVLNRDPEPPSELSSPASQSEFPPFDLHVDELPKDRKNRNSDVEILNLKSDKRLEGPRHSSPCVTKMDLKNFQHSTPLRNDINNSKFKESPMFANSQRTRDTMSRTVLSPLVNNGETKEERVVKHKCFVASSLQIEHMKEIQKLAMMNDCKFHTKFSPSVTHVIVSTKPFGSRVCDRTLKFFQGLANKCWIMDYQWVIDSRKAGYLLPEDNYEIKGDTVTSENHNGPRKVRLSRKPLFKNFQICIISSSDGLTPDNLRELFTTCHGEVVTDVKDFSVDTNNFIVTCTDYDEENPTDEEIKIFNRYYRQHRVLTITREWVLDSLTLNTIQPLKDYVLTCVKGMTVPDLR